MSTHELRDRSRSEGIAGHHPAWIVAFVEDRLALAEPSHPAGGPDGRALLVG